MKKDKVIFFIFVLPILANCQSLDPLNKASKDIESSYFDRNNGPDIRGIISYDKYQVVVANGDETVLEIANRLELEPRKFALFNGLVESYRPRQGELLALNENISPIKKATESSWTQKNTKDIIEKVKEKKQASIPKNGYAKHKVEAGETIYSIGRLYNVSVTSLAKINNLDTEFTINVGQNIIVPIAQNRIVSKKINKKSASTKIVVDKKNSERSSSRSGLRI